MEMTQKYLLTKEGLGKLKKELEVLEKVKRPEVIERIQEAAAHGDLSENADYAQAKEEQAMMEARIMQLEEMVKNAELISGQHPKNIVAVGSTVKVRIDGELRAYTIVGSGEANPSTGRISNESLVGRSLLGAKVNEKVSIQTPAGQKTYEVTEIS
ncbi:MAG: transcription elongation factor GreA [Candidatus Doudnabacteria bacterium]|nr:transcription elongation factor GreA [Candidatus Doudnabacteria bacterium]